MYPVPRVAVADVNCGYICGCALDVTWLGVFSETLTLDYLARG
jgi:hypothetical protein